MKKLLRSSTFQAALALPLVQAIYAKLGVVFPVEFLLAGIGAYGIKEAAAKVADARASSAATAPSSALPSDERLP